MCYQVFFTIPHFVAYYFFRNPVQIDLPIPWCSITAPFNSEQRRIVHAAQLAMTAQQERFIAGNTSTYLVDMHSEVDLVAAYDNALIAWNEAKENEINTIQTAVVQGDTDPEYEGLTVAGALDDFDGANYILNNIGSEIIGSYEVVMHGAFDIEMQNVNESKGSLDRWYATAGEGPIDVTWNVNISRSGNYILDISGLSSWDKSNITVSVVGGGISQTATLGDIIIPEAGDYEITLHGIGVPEKPVVEEVTFTLKDRMILPENIVWDRMEAKFNSMFIADHAEQFDESSIFKVSVDGNQETITGVTELINKFAPILHFNEGERFAIPFAVDSIQLPDGGSSDAELDFSEWGNQVDQTPDVEAKMYSSVLEKDGKLAINYYFFFPRSDWSEQGGLNTHEGDWESVVLFFERDDQSSWEPTKVFFSQHIKVFGFGGGEVVDYSQAVVNSPNIHAYIGLGGHASYPNSDVDKILGIDEYHLDNSENPGISISVDAEYLPRINSAVMLDSYHWLGYTGLWGSKEAVGSTAPRGPAFINSSFPESLHEVGLEWIDPWRHISLLSNE